MADDQLKKELEDAVANQSKMDHVDTKKTASEVALKLKCQECDEQQEFPVHDDEQMELSDDGNTLNCEVDGCDKTMPTPKHHDKAMKPFIVKA